MSDAPHWHEQFVMKDAERTDRVEEELPEVLRHALVDLQKPRIPVPGQIDVAILREARLTFGRRRRLWIGTRWAAAILAAAAMVTIAVRLFVTGIGPDGGRERPQLAQVADVNHDNKVNILDAYIVARHISRHEALDPAWDVNGDGVVDQKDVDQIAQMAVAAPDAEQAR
jgi:hypothetical protein